MAMKKQSPKATQKPITPVAKKKCGSHMCSQAGSHKHKEAKTKIIARFDCGFPNSLFIRGEGVATLSWDKGVAMKNISPNEWMWESERPCSVVQFKVLVNDTCYEQGENHTVAFGQSVELSPKF